MHSCSDCYNDVALSLPRMHPIPILSVIILHLIYFVNISVLSMNALLCCFDVECNLVIITITPSKSLFLLPLLRCLNYCCNAVFVGRMIIDITKWFVVLVLVVFSFACGLNQLLWYYAQSAANQCDDDSNTQTCNSKFSRYFSE